MNFKECLKTACYKSKMHGVRYLFEPNLHWLERLFWLVIIIAAAYFSTKCCIVQLKRFYDEPLVYGFELTAYKLDFPFPGYTICTNYSDEDAKSALVARLFINEIRNHSQREYYLKFFDVLNNLYSTNLDTLEPYENDTTLERVNMASTLGTMRHNEMNDQTEIGGKKMAPSLNEGGWCYTTSELSAYTNPDRFKTLEVPDVIYCNYLNKCVIEIFLTSVTQVNTSIRVYIHSKYDVPTIDDGHTVLFELNQTQIANLELDIQWLSAEKAVRRLPLAFRNCRFTDENHLKYFKTYTPALCHMECRINAALKLCNCKPHFYTAMVLNVPPCNVSGLLCLHANNWLSQTVCSCPTLCEFVAYTIQNIERKTEEKFNTRSISFKIEIPYMSLKTRVILNLFQMILSVGGALSLCFGLSVASVNTFVFVWIVYLIEKLIECWRSRRSRRFKVRRVRQAKVQI